MSRAYDPHAYIQTISLPIGNEYDPTYAKVLAVWTLDVYATQAQTGKRDASRDVFLLLQNSSSVTTS